MLDAETRGTAYNTDTQPQGTPITGAEKPTIVGNDTINVGGKEYTKEQIQQALQDYANALAKGNTDVIKSGEDLLQRLQDLGFLHGNVSDAITGNTPDNPLDGLKDSIQSLYEMLLNPDGDMASFGSGIADILKKFQTYFRSNFDGVSPNEALNLSQSLYNTLSGYITARLDYLYQRENWQFQQSYNSPLSQMRRLMEAGINPAFYYGCLGSSDAGEIGGAQTPSGQMTAQVEPLNYGSRQAKQFVDTAMGIGQTGLNVASSLEGIGAFQSGTAQAAKTKTETDLLWPEFRLQRQTSWMNAYAGLMNAGANQMNAKTNQFSANVDKAFKDSIVQYNDKQIQLGYDQLQNAWTIAKLGSDTSLGVARIGANASVQSAKIGARSNITSAVLSGEYNKWIAKANIKAQKQMQSQGLKNDLTLKSADAWLQIVPTLYREQDVTKEVIIDTQTGEEHQLKEGANGQWHAPSLVGTLDFGGSLENLDKQLSSNKRFKRETRHTRESQLDFDRCANLLQIQTYVGNALMNGSLNATDGMRFLQRLEWGQEKMQGFLNKRSADAFTKYTFNQYGIPTYDFVSKEQVPAFTNSISKP